MAFFPTTLDRQQSDELAIEIQRRMNDQGWGLCAIEIPGEARFIGFTGLNRLRDEFPFATAVEVGWRLAHDFWGKGYASEAARAVVDTGFMQLHLQQIVAFTAVPKLRSQAVMKLIGMVFEGETFEHPGIAPGHPLRKHRRYRINHPVTASPPR